MPTPMLACVQSDRQRGQGRGRAAPGTHSSLFPPEAPTGLLGLCVPLQPGVRTSSWSGTGSQCEPAWQAHGGFIPPGPHAAARGCSWWLSHPSPRAWGGSSTCLPRPQDQEWRECSGGTWAPVTQRWGEAKAAGVLCPSLLCLPWWARRLGRCTLVGTWVAPVSSGFPPTSSGGSQHSVAGGPHQLLGLLL